MSRGGLFLSFWLVIAASFAAGFSAGKVLTGVVVFTLGCALWIWADEIALGVNGGTRK